MTHKLRAYGTPNNFIFQTAKLVDEFGFYVLVWLSEDKKEIYVATEERDLSGKFTHSNPLKIATGVDNISKFSNRIKVDLIYQNNIKGEKTAWIILSD